MPPERIGALHAGRNERDFTSIPIVSRDRPSAPTNLIRIPAYSSASRIVVPATVPRSKTTPSSTSMADLSHQLFDACDVVADPLSLQVDVTSRPPNREYGQQHTALEHQVVPVPGDGDPSEERLQHIQRLQLLHISTRLPSETLDR